MPPLYKLGFQPPPRSRHSYTAGLVSIQHRQLLPVRCAVPGHIRPLWALSLRANHALLANLQTAQVLRNARLLHQVIAVSRSSFIFCALCLFGTQNVIQYDRYAQVIRTLLRLPIAGPLISASAEPAATGSSNMGVIIGAAVGGAVAVMVTLGFSWRFYVNRKRKILVPDNNKTVLGADKEALSASLVAVVDESDDFDAVFSNHQVWIRETSSSLGCMP